MHLHITFDFALIHAANGGCWQHVLFCFAFTASSFKLQLQWKCEKLLLTPVPETVISIVQKRLLTKPPYGHVNIDFAFNFCTNAYDQKKRSSPRTLLAHYFQSWLLVMRRQYHSAQLQGPTSCGLDTFKHLLLLTAWEVSNISDILFWEAKSSLLDWFAQVQDDSLIAKGLVLARGFICSFFEKKSLITSLEPNKSAEMMPPFTLTVIFFYIHSSHICKKWGFPNLYIKKQEKKATSTTFKIYFDNTLFYSHTALGL